LFSLNLDHPDSVVFDEVHYVTTARHFNNGTLINPGWGDRALPYNYEHPPAAKWFIAGSMQVFGDNPVGWRVPSMLVGAAGVAGASLLGRRLFGSPVAGVAAGSLVLLDNLYYLQARMAMLDVFATSFTVWAFALALGGPWERRASGLVYGVAVASKYNALFLAPLFVVLHFLRTPSSRMVYARPAWAAAWSVGVPVLVFVAFNVPFLVAWSQMGGAGYAVSRFVLTQWAAFTWDFGADASHGYASRPWLWIPMARPVWYFVARLDGGVVQYIYSVGNAFVWWPAFAAAVYFAVASSGRFLARRGRVLVGGWFWTNVQHVGVSWTRDARAFAAAVVVLFSWVPYFAIQRITFMFYMVFSVPWFAVMLSGPIAWSWSRGGAWRAGVAAYGVLVAAFFVVYFPIVAALDTSEAYVKFLFNLVPWMRR
jgi:predicted membrane-bound dolichyl-phosphate-mannose-protein mannosyltransferase